MIKIKELLNESKYTLYHNSFTDACEEAIKLAKKSGYEIDENDWFTAVATKYGRGRPSVGKTNKFQVQLLKNNTPSKRNLLFQVYGMENGKFELNVYIA